MGAHGRSLARRVGVPERSLARGVYCVLLGECGDTYGDVGLRLTLRET